MVIFFENLPILRVFQKKIMFYFTRKFISDYGTSLFLNFKSPGVHIHFDCIRTGKKYVYFISILHSAYFKENLMDCAFFSHPAESHKSLN